MVTRFVLPLFPLPELVLLPTVELEVTPGGPLARGALARARQHQGMMVVSLYEDEAVHEVGVKALILDARETSVQLRGLQRCRLRELVPDAVPMVEAEPFPDTAAAPGREEPLRRLLLRRFARLCLRLQRALPAGLPKTDLSALTWRITDALDLETSQKQGLLNVPDALTRAKILLLALRDAERRERFLRPFAHLREGGQWN